MINSDLSQSSTLNETMNVPVSNSPPLEKYQLLSIEYIKSGFHQSVEKIARIISLSPKLFENFRFQPTFLLLRYTIHSLLMNPIETTVLAHLLDQILQAPTTYTAEVFLMYTGYSVKKFLNSDLDEISTFLESKFPNFQESFEVWEAKTRAYIDLNLDEILSMHKFYTRFSGLPTNYNSYVDEILHYSPPYQVNKRTEIPKKKKKGKPKKYESEESSEEFFVLNEGIRDIGDRQVYSKIWNVLKRELNHDVDVEDLVRGVCKSRRKNKILLEVSMMF